MLDVFPQPTDQCERGLFGRRLIRTNRRNADPNTVCRPSMMADAAHSQSRGNKMSEEREKVRCRSCELVQWSDRANCRRCGSALPEPIVRIVERVVEKVVIRQDPECLQKLEQAHRLISAATERIKRPSAEDRVPILFRTLS